MHIAPTALIMALRLYTYTKKVTLEEILVLRRVWITLRHQWGKCLKPVGLSFDPLVK